MFSLLDQNYREHSGCSFVASAEFVFVYILYPSHMIVPGIGDLQIGSHLCNKMSEISELHQKVTFFEKEEHATELHSLEMQYILSQHYHPQTCVHTGAWWGSDRNHYNGWKYLRDIACSLKDNKCSLRNITCSLSITHR